MEWFNKFKVGQKVKVVKKVGSWMLGEYTEVRWSSYMNKTINRAHIVKDIDMRYGYQLDTHVEFGYDFWYSPDSLRCVKGEQLLFDFINI